MDETTRSEDGWVMARLVALEQANRRLWLGIAALFMTLISVALAGFLFVGSLELPAVVKESAPSASLEANDLTLHGALRVIDESGRNLIWIGREPVTAGASAAPAQSVIGLFSTTGAEAPLQTVRIATSKLGSALSLGTPDGSESVSAFAGDDGVALELRRGDKTRVLSERAEGPTTTASAPAPAPVARETKPEGKRTEAPAVAARGAEAERGTTIDLSDPQVQPLGSDFFVGQLSLDDSRGVLRVSGRLINASSVDQLRAEFRLTVGSREIPFSVGRISAGGSTAFTVELPSANSAALRSARLRWVRSTLSYLTE